MEDSMSQLLLASVTAIGLLLAGPQKVSAQTVFACVSSAANSPIIIEPTANAPCPPSAGGQTWTKITLSQTPGPIAARQYNCDSQTVAVGANVSFVDTGLGFGTTLPTPIGSFSSFLLQPGLYQAHLSVSAAQSTSPPQFFAFGFFGSAFWLIPSGSPVSGDRLFQVNPPNTSVAVQLSGGSTPVSIFLGGGPCLLILTQLH
jgi:hypothetical protein